MNPENITLIENKPVTKRQILHSSTYELPGDSCCGLVAKSRPTLVTPWTAAHQALLSKGFPRQEYWSGLPFPSPGDLSDPGIKPVNPVLLQGRYHCSQFTHREKEALRG